MRSLSNSKLSSLFGKITVLSALSLTLFSYGTPVSPVSPVMATPLPATPNYEVKLFLDPDAALNSNNQLKSSVRDYFDMPETKTKMSIQYLDTDSLELNEEGWAARVRKMEDFTDQEFELTYKIRYPITNGDIDAALAQAALDGFDAGENDYEAQVDWGYTKQTLSFSNKKIVEKSGYDGMELPTKSDSRSMLIDNAPGKFENWLYTNWGSDKLDIADKYGPVDAKRWIGTWQEQELYIEVWEIIEEDGTGYDYIVEASFKTDSRTDAATLKTQLQNELTQQGWFLPTDELKTQMILQRY